MAEAVGILFVIIIVLFLSAAAIVGMWFVMLAVYAFVIWLCKCFGILK